MAGLALWHVYWCPQPPGEDLSAYKTCLFRTDRSLLQRNGQVFPRMAPAFQQRLAHSVVETAVLFGMGNFLPSDHGTSSCTSVDEASYRSSLRSIDTKCRAGGGAAVGFAPILCLAVGFTPILCLAVGFAPHPLPCGGFCRWTVTKPTARKRMHCFATDSPSRTHRSTPEHQQNPPQHHPPPADSLPTPGDHRSRPDQPIPTRGATNPTTNPDTQHSSSIPGNPRHERDNSTS